MRVRKWAYALTTMALAVVMAGCSMGLVKAASETEEETYQDAGSFEIKEFTVGPGDTIEIKVYRSEDLLTKVRVGGSGRIMMPLIGDVDVAGKSVFTIRDEVRERLAKYVNDPQVTVSVTDVQSLKVMILGEVYSPGVFYMSGSMTALEGIARAGGSKLDARLDNVLVSRAGREGVQYISLDLEKFAGQPAGSQAMLQPGDIVYVPAKPIAKVARFFTYLSQILGPIVQTESGIVLWDDVEDVLSGNENNSRLTIPAQ